jgi:hypothetical protein
MTICRLRSYPLNRSRACFCFRSPVPMMTRPAGPQLLKRRAASHPAGDAASSTNQAMSLQSVMPTPRSIYIRRGSSSRMIMRCLASVILAEYFRDHLAHDHFAHQFRVIERLARRRRCGALWNLANPRHSSSFTLARSIAVREDKRIDTMPSRHAKTVALSCPQFIGSAAGTGFPIASSF